MTDLIINFDTETQTSKRTHIQTTPGSWTHKLKQKRKARYLDRKNANHPPAVPIETKDPESKKAPKVEKRKERSKDDSLGDRVEFDNNLEAGAVTKPSKKIRLEAKTAPPKPLGKIQVISSLFSSTIIPTIKSPSTSDQPTVTVYAPSNASLSDIDIASPSLSLHPQISHHLSSSPRLGQIRSPTGIQSIAWPVLTAQSNNLTRDVIIQSQTGSGKTLAYLVPIIQDLLTLASGQSGKVWTREVGTLAIVLVPTRELAEQVYNVAISLLAFARAGGSQSKDKEGAEVETEIDPNEFGAEKQAHSEGLNPRWLVPGTLHGGTNRTHEKARLRRGLPLLVCTPGRLLDHLEKTTSLRMAGEPVPSINDHSNKKKQAQVDDLINGMDVKDLSLRWLVVDEADRLMDMGFEEQMRGILKHLTGREAKTCEQVNRTPGLKNGRRTVLCSATMPDGVKKLVGLTLNDPIVLKSGDSQPTDKSHSEASAEDATSHHERNNFSAPSQLSQHYVVAPPKLRLVSLLALLRHITKQNQKNPAEKVLVFMSCTASVDFHFEAVSGTSLGRPDEFPGRIQAKAQADETDEEASPIMRHSSLLPGVKIFRLHGNLDLQTRLASLNAFSKSNTSAEPASSSILFCTSLAGRGLDVPFVSHVIQYDLPTEGGVTEYLHRVGRTARAGKDGQAWSFLLPSEEGWVKWCESNQKDSAGSAKLREVGVQKLLQDGFGGKCQKDWETRATDAQMAIERWVISSPENTSLASTGFSSHIRAYATHPSEEKRFFHVKNLHLGHLAKAFGLREAPKQISTSHSSNQAPQSKSKRSEKIAKRRNLERGSDDDEEGTFEVLSQFKHKKNGNVLRGPIANGVDEFNVGDVSQLLAARR